MLYKYYRFVILIKVIFLIIWWNILFRQRKSDYATWWTTIIIQSWDQQDIDAYHIISTLDTTPWPWALVFTDKKSTQLHIPWTYDTGYILQYLRNWLPPIKDNTNKNIYETSCIQKITVDWSHQKIDNCQKYWINDGIRAILFIILWVIL